MKYAIKESTLTAIAEAIRSGKGTTDLINPNVFDEEITAFLDNFRKLIECDMGDLVIPYETTKIGDYLFYHGTTLKSIYIPSTVTTIGHFVFERGRGLKSIVIPDSVTEMGNYVFYGHYDIETVVIGDGVPTIGIECFYDCQSLKSITFGKGVTTISANAFLNCRNCLTYDFSKCEKIPTLLSSNAFSGINDNAKILVPEHLYRDWSTQPNWADLAEKGFLVGVINFYINGNVCKTVPGMTWEEWINSALNTVGATNHDGVVYVNEKPLYIIGAGYTESYVDSSLILVTDMVQDMAYNNSSIYVAFKLCGKWTFGLAGKTLEEWIASPFNNLGAHIQEDEGLYRVYLSDGTYGTWYNTREEIADVPLYDGAIYS